MRFHWRVSVVVAGLSAGAVSLAQETPKSTDAPQGERPAAERPVARERAGGRRAGTPDERGGFRPLVAIQRLREELKLSDEQKTQFDEMVTQIREQLSQQTTDEGDVRELLRQMREASQAGDTEKADQLRQQLRERRGAGGGGQRVVVQKFLDDLETILTDEQKQKLGEMRERLLQGPQRGDRRGGANVEERIRELRSQLELSDDQASRFDVAAENLKKATGQGDGENLRREMREASEGGDEERTAQVRERVQARRESMTKAVEAFVAEVTPILTEPQVEKLQAFREQVERGGRGGEGRGGADRNDPRTLVRAARRLDLSQEQRDQLRTIEEEAGKLTREAGRDAEALTAVRKSIEKDIREMLTPDQAKQFEAAMQRQGGPRRGDREGGERRARGAGGGEGGDPSAERPRRTRRSGGEETP